MYDNVHDHHYTAHGHLRGNSCCKCGVPRPCISEHTKTAHLTQCTCVYRVKMLRFCRDFTSAVVEIALEGFEKFHYSRIAKEARPLHSQLLLVANISQSQKSQILLVTKISQFTVSAIMYSLVLFCVTG